MLTTQADRFSSEEVRAPPRTVLEDDIVEFQFKQLKHNLFFPPLFFFTSCPKMEQMFAAFPPDVAGNLDYKNLVHVITHGEEKDQE